MGWSGAGVEDQSPSPARVALSLTRHGGPMEGGFRPWSWAGPDSGPQPDPRCDLGKAAYCLHAWVSSSEEDLSGMNGDSYT